ADAENHRKPSQRHGSGASHAQSKCSTATNRAGPGAGPSHKALSGSEENVRKAPPRGGAFLSGWAEPDTYLNAGAVAATGAFALCALPRRTPFSRSRTGA